MHLVLIMAVLLAMTLAENAPHAPVDHPSWRLAWGLTAMLLVPAMAATVSMVVVHNIRRDVHSWATWLTRFSWAQHLHSVLWLGLVGAMSYGLGWPQLVRENWGLGDWLLVDDLLILAPVYVPILLSWAAFYEVDRLVEELTVADDSPEPRLPARWRYVLLHARHYLALVLAPLLLILLVHDAARIWIPEFAAGPYGWLVLALPMLSLVVLLPQLLTSMWKTERLAASALRDRLEEVLIGCRLQVRDILVWKTEGRMINAAVSGVWSRMRYVLLTDGLLARLESEQIEAVLRHELGHVARRHLLLRMLMLGLPAAIWVAIDRAMPQGLTELSELVASYGILPQWQTGILVPLAMACYGIFGLGGYCKQLEFEADLYACGMIGKGDVIDTNAAATAFITALDDITQTSGSSRTHEGWLHPSIERRADFIMAAQTNSPLIAKFERQLTGFAWLIAGGYLLSFVVVALSL